jgi:uncharacterized protein (TIGR04222 family)
MWDERHCPLTVLLIRERIMAEVESSPDSTSVFVVKEDPLYQAIQDLRLAETDIDFPFEGKLAYQCSWTRGYSIRVVAEYRRFLYLTQVSSSPIAPSDAVDQAWHLHLLQTYFYWDVMCTGLFGKSLHHTPTLSGSTGRDADISRYKNVLREYKKAFGESPPQDIWPSIEERFGRLNNDKKSHFGNEFSLSQKIPSTVAMLILILVSMTFWGASHMIPNVDLHANYLFLMTSLAILSPVVLCLISLNANDNFNVAALSSYEAAYLKHGVNHLVNTALIRLVELGLVTFITNGKKGDEGKAMCQLVLPPQSPPIALDACELAVLSELTANNGSWTLQQLSTKTSYAISQVRSQLIRAGLINQSGNTSMYDLTMAIVAAIGTMLFAISYGVNNVASAFSFVALGLMLGPLWIPIYFMLKITGKESKTRAGKASLKSAALIPIDAKSMNYKNNSAAMRFAVMGSAAVIDDIRFYGINYLEGAITATAHSDDKAGCGDNLPKCG